MIKKLNIFILKSLVIFSVTWFENFIYFVLIYPLIKISRTNKEDTRPNISFLLLIFKYSKIVLNKLLNKYDSALIKKLIKGTKAAIEIDSAKEEKNERTNTTIKKSYKNNLGNN